MFHKLHQTVVSMALLLALLASIVIVAPVGAQSGDRRDDRREDPIVSRVGIVLLYVRDGGPADVAGLQSGDVVLAINGIPVQQFRRTMLTVRTTRRGEHLSLVVRSGDEVKVVELVAGINAEGRRSMMFGVVGLPIFGQDTRVSEVEQSMNTVPVDEVMRPGASSEAGNGDDSAQSPEIVVPAPGVEVPNVTPVTPVNPPAGLENCVSEQTWAFGIVEVLPDSPAAEAGLAENDAIVTIDGAPIPAGVQAESLLADYAPGDTVVFGVVRPEMPSQNHTQGAPTDGATSNVTEVSVTLGEHPSVADRAFLGVMGMPVMMSETMTCSGTAPAQPVPAEPVPTEPNSGASPADNGSAATKPERVGGTDGSEAGVDAQAMPPAPPAVSGGAIISSTNEGLDIQGETGPTFCWSGAGFVLCGDSVPEWQNR